MKSHLTTIAATFAVAAALVVGVPQHGLAKGAKGAAKSQSVTGCLQKGDEARQGSAPPKGMRLIDWTGELRDQVEDYFDGLAGDWHTRTSPQRTAVVMDALSRGLGTIDSRVE